MRRSDEAVLRAVAGARVGGNGWMRGHCPFCEGRIGKADKKKCLGLQTPSGKWACFRCGAGGYVAHMPDDMRDLLLPAAVEAAKAAAKAMDPPEGFYLLFDGPGLRSRSLDAPRRYLTAPQGPKSDRRSGRGLPVDVLRAAKVGACVTGTYEGRVVVPVFGTEPGDDGELPWLGWSSRPWVPDPKGLGYRYPEGMALSQLLYNHAALLVATDKPAPIVEGVFDAHALWPDACAALGGTKDGHFPALLAARRPVVLLPDGDAWEKGWVIAMHLRFEGQRAGVVRLPPRVDPDEVPRDVLEDAAVRSLDQDIVRL